MSNEKELNEQELKQVQGGLRAIYNAGSRTGRTHGPAQPADKPAEEEKG